MELTAKNPLMIARRLPVIHLAIALLVFAVPVSAQQLSVKEIMKEPSIAGMRVSGERLSPDGKWVVYLWNAGGVYPRDLYLVATAGGNPEKLLSPSDLEKEVKAKKADPLEYGVVVDDDFARSRKNDIGNLRWSRDSSKLLFVHNGDIYVLKRDLKKPKRVTKTESFEFSADFLDDDRILFQQGGNFFAINTADGSLTQISKEANQKNRISVFGATKSEDGSMLAYIASDRSKQRALFVPNYLPYYTSAPTVRRGWSKFKLYTAKTDGSFEKAVEINLPDQEGEGFVADLEWLADNRTLIIDRIDKTHKRRQIFVVDTLAEKPDLTLVHEEEDDKWIGRISRILGAHRTDANRFFFASEVESGFNHLFMTKLQRPSPGREWQVTTERLTSGKWEVGWAKWFSEDVILFSSTREGTAERTIQQIVIGNEGSPTLRDTFEGMRTGLQSEGGSLVFEGSDWRTPADLYALPNLCLSCRDIKRPINLTNTAPEAFLQRKWNQPQFIAFGARDGKMVPARIYLPSGFDKSKKYPMVIFVHGAGYLQNVINGWNNYFREFMFNQLLTQRGYVVLDIDYRGSAGYGRDWRTDVYDFLGGKDYEDHVDGVDFMEEQYNIDKSSVGVYGGSYGGFMAAMLALRAPGHIKAAAALRPVMDWKNYYSANPFYTSQRLGDPKKNPEAYKRSSPISYAPQLERKLLILHGILDDNVHVQDSIQLVEQLIRHDKTEYFELMLYPAERHSFQRPASWEDEYERVLALFEEELN